MKGTSFLAHFGAQFSCCNKDIRKPLAAKTLRCTDCKHNPFHGKRLPITSFGAPDIGLRPRRSLRFADRCSLDSRLDIANRPPAVMCSRLTPIPGHNEWN